MTTHAQAAQRRDAQIEAAHASDTLRKAKRAIMALLFMALPALAQPYNTPPKPPEFAQTDLDGNNTLNANDFQQFQTKFAVAKSWVDDLITNAPGQVSGLGGAAAAQTVTLTWTNASRPQTAVYVLRAGQVIKTLAGNVATTTDAPGGGTWVYSVTTGNGSGGFLYPPLAPAPTVSVTVQGAPPPPDTGWTAFAHTNGRDIFVSPTGNDANTGLAQAQAVRTLAKGYALARDGFDDWVLLQSGGVWTETINWNKSALSDLTYMVVGSYGSGARPKLNVNGSIGIMLDHNRRGIAIVDIDFQGPGNGSGFTGITGFSPASHILVENCRFDDLPTGVVFQETNQPDRIRDLKIRRCVFSNIIESGPQHSQAAFIGNTDLLVMEGNVGYRIALNQSNQFDHFGYLSETDGTSDFDENLVAMVSSHSCQQRSGGRMRNNLFLRNPIGAFQGTSTGGGGPTPNNYFAYNVAIDSRNINPTDVRGFGFVLSGGPGSICENNIAAYQTSGTSNVDAFDFDSWAGLAIRGNTVWDWSAPVAGSPGWPTAFHFENGSVAQIVSGNKLVSHLPGMLIRWERPWSGIYSGNTYWTATPPGGTGGYFQFAYDAGNGEAFGGWKTRTGDTSMFLTSAPPQVAATIGDYLQSLGVAPGPDPVDTLMQQAVLQSRANWRPQFTAPVINNWIRGKFGVAGPAAP